MEKSNRVVCISEFWSIGNPSPKKDEIYTVAKTLEHSSEIYYLLKGFPDNHAYCAIGFRPVDEQFGADVCKRIEQEFKLTKAKV